MFLLNMYLSFNKVTASGRARHAQETSATNAKMATFWTVTGVTGVESSAKRALMPEVVLRAYLDTGDVNVTQCVR